MTEELRIHVAGVPVPQGSKTAGKTRAGRAFVRDANAAKLKPWRALVQEVAEQVVEDAAWETTDGPVYLSLLFVMPRPQSAPKRLFWAKRKPDLDKLIRAVCDALTAAGVWTDDSRVVNLLATKELARDGHEPGVRITVCPIAD